MTSYDPAEVERLAKSLRLMATDDRIPNVWRSPLTSAAAQLEAARAEVERLDALNAVLAKQSRELDTVLVDRITELESELASLRASVVDAMSSAGPEADDERTA